MIFSISFFVVSWICFFVFADKKRVAEISPTCLLAMYLACATDLLVHHYELWDYPAPSKMQTFWRHLMHDFSVYPIVTYLFLQTLPKKQTFATVTLHIFYWSILAILIEWIAIKTGSMKHKLWWSFYCSYLSDWILFLIFYFHHKWQKKHIKT